MKAVEIVSERPIKQFKVESILLQRL